MGACRLAPNGGKPINIDVDLKLFRMILLRGSAQSPAQIGIVNKSQHGRGQ